MDDLADTSEVGLNAWRAVVKTAHTTPLQESMGAVVGKNPEMYMDPIGGRSESRSR